MNESRNHGCTAESGHLNRPLDGPKDRPWRILAGLGAVLWLGFHVLVPARYYVLPGFDPYDERFSWRMFSAVRVQRCEVEVDETVLGEARRLRLETILPMPWIVLVERNRPAVQRELLRFLCRRATQPTRVDIRSNCVEASGEPAPRLRRAIDCATGAVEEERGEPADGGAQ